MEYLNEERLGETLRLIFNKEFIYDKAVPNSKNKRKRPDYRNDELMLIVEFDGFQHYNCTKNILSDIEKDKDYSELGYKVIRIPYFIQLNTDTINRLFNIKLEKDIYKYPQGFIDNKALLPSDFCELGIEKFVADLEIFSHLKEDILDSLKNKINELKDIRLVLPKSLLYLLDK